jgi:hypothetical protein
MFTTENTEKRYHVFTDALGRPHYYFGSDAEAKIEAEKFTAWGVGMADGLAQTAMRSLTATANDFLWDVARSMEDDGFKKSGFSNGDELVALTCAAHQPNFQSWMPNDDQNFRQQYLKWVVENIGFSVDGEARFLAVVSAVLKKEQHPAYAIAYARHYEGLMNPSEPGYQAWANTHP